MHCRSMSSRHAVIPAFAGMTALDPRFQGDDSLGISMVDKYDTRGFLGSRQVIERKVIMQIESHIRKIQDFPKKGVLFYDITPVLGHKDLFKGTIDLFVDRFKKENIEMVVGIESRGFIFGSAIASRLGTGLCLVRKVGKLPFKTIKKSYDLEYGSDHLEMHEDGIIKGSRVLIIDDLLATGGTAAATAHLVEEVGGEVVALAFLIEIASLNGRKQLGGREVVTFIQYP